MKREFMKWLRNYIEVCPGLTAEEYARDGYWEGYVKSDAKNGDQVFSLASSLMKQVRDGKEPHIRRERIGGKLRYFPSIGLSTAGNVVTEKIAFQISLSKQEWQSIDDLVSSGQFHNRNDVIEWLAKRCISVGVGLSPSLPKEK